MTNPGVDKKVGFQLRMMPNFGMMNQHSEASLPRAMPDNYDLLLRKIRMDQQLRVQQEQLREPEPVYRPRPAAAKSNERETSLAFFKKKILKNFKRKPIKNKHRRPMVKLGAHELQDGECNNLILNMTKDGGTPESRQNRQPGIFDRSAITLNSETFAILKDQGQQADFAPLSGNRSNVLSSRREREAQVEKHEYAAIMMGISGVDASTNKTRSSRRKLNDILDEENIKSI